MDELRKGLMRHGKARIAARAKAKAESEEVAALAKEAVASGMTKAEVCALAQISRPALDTMLNG
jgi:hypothetical protein